MLLFLHRVSLLQVSQWPCSHCRAVQVRPLALARRRRPGVATCDMDGSEHMKKRSQTDGRRSVALN